MAARQFGSEPRTDGNERQADNTTYGEPRGLWLQPEPGCQGASSSTPSLAATGSMLSYTKALCPMLYAGAAPTRTGVYVCVRLKPSQIDQRHMPLRGNTTRAR